MPKTFIVIAPLSPFIMISEWPQMSVTSIRMSLLPCHLALSYNYLEIFSPKIEAKISSLDDKRWKRDGGTTYEKVKVEPPPTRMKMSTSPSLIQVTSSAIWRGKFNCSSHLFLTFSPIRHAVLSPFPLLIIRGRAEYRTLNAQSSLSSSAGRR